MEKSVVTVFVVTWYAIISEAFDLTIIHTNDVHARFEEFNKYGSTCSVKYAEKGACFGGVARRVTKIKEIRNRYQNTLLLDGGDQFQGTPWFYFYRGLAASHFMELMGYDAMALGNHEFDLGIDGLVKFLNNVTFPVLSCNIDATHEPRIQGLFQKSVVLNVGGEEIGIVGYTFHGSPDLTSTGKKLIFSDEIQAVQTEIDRLMDQGINKIIGLGHSGYDVDMRIAKNTVGLDVIVGGHTDTFLYSGTPPTDDVVMGPYPTIVIPDGAPRDKVLIVQDFTWGKYLGFLQVTFDEEGKITKYNGNPITLDASVAKDEETLAEIQKFEEPMEASIGHVIGESYVLLDGRRLSCRTGECNLGNVVTDSMVEDQVTYKGDDSWSDVSVAITNSGAIRTTITQGEITIGEVNSVLPFLNTNDVVELEGKYLLEALEHSVSDYDPIALPGRFLQFSGLIVSYDLTKPAGSRVLSVEVKCSNCSVPDYEPLQVNKVYKIIIPTYLAGGGDGYTMISENKKSHITGNLDAAALLNYISKHSPVLQGIERRLHIINSSSSFSDRLSPSCTIYLVVVTLNILFNIRFTILGA
ncbi:5'-nucleotidase [Holothuria leucospilota]|uniref:5'-nucleotidase n=1 Tax=Holothuria leucospilota TaxID=206669 RepID=A0A9Q0YJR8_HOLLE|nr:5'-nucleotidase [Holothuria leucospilota]